jgi:hypothetical protein
MNQIPILHSIQSIDRVIQTDGSQPVEVLCSDFRSYICKYLRPSPQLLVKEFISNRFLHHWNILTPEIAFVQISQNHLPLDRLGRRQNLQDFESVCFGSKIMDNSDDFRRDLAMEGTPNPSSIHRMDWLRICLFDIWVCNEDRTQNNPNLLLIGLEKGPRRLAAIDHANIFNSGFLSRNLVPLTLEDSLLYAPITHCLYKKSPKTREEIESILADFRVCIVLCNSSLDGIIELIPDTWLSEKSLFKDKCRSIIFSEEWIQSVEFTFRTFATQIGLC